MGKESKGAECDGVGSGAAGVDRSQSLPAELSRRAQMILRLVNGESNGAVARRYRVSRPTVSLWRTQYRDRGLAGLHNELKPDRPRSTSEVQLLNW